MDPLSSDLVDFAMNRQPPKNTVQGKGFRQTTGNNTIGFQKLVDIFESAVHDNLHAASR